MLNRSVRVCNRYILLDTTSSRQWCPRNTRLARRLIIDHPSNTPVHSPPPRPVHKHRTQTHHYKETAYAASDDVKVIADGADTVPEATLWLRDVLHQRQELDDADEGRNKNRDARQDDGVV